MYVKLGARPGKQPTIIILPCMLYFETIICFHSLGYCSEEKAEFISFTFEVPRISLARNQFRSTYYVPKYKFSI